MFTTHTLGQVADANKLTDMSSMAKTDFLTLHAGTVTEQVAFNHRLFGLDKVSTTKQHSTEWYDTCSYYDALSPDTTLAPELDMAVLLDQIKQAEAAGFQYKASVIGPVSLLQTLRFESEEVRIAYFDKLLPLYTKLISELSLTSLSWVQLDEPMLTQPLTRELRHAFRSGYFRLQRSPVKLMVVSCFGVLSQNLQLACQLPVQALHVDALQAKQMMSVVDWLPRHKILSLGVINGQDLAKSDLSSLLTRLKPVAARLKERLWLAPNQSFMHLPVDESQTANTDESNAFVLQKIRELNALAQALQDGKFKQSVRIPRTNSPEDVVHPEDNAKVANGYNPKSSSKARTQAHNLRLVHSR